MVGEDEWVTWPQAAAIVGCPIPTIDWYTRLGRIEKRPFRGPRPTLRRSSVVEFAAWWRDRQQSRQRAREDRLDGRRRRQAAVEPPSPSGWMSSQDAAEFLQVTRGHVVWLIESGHLEGLCQGRRWWVRSSSVVGLVRRREAESQWVSAADAARMVGCSQNAILRAAHRGEIGQRKVDRHRPSLSRRSVEEFQGTWTARQEARAARRLPVQRPASAPPDDEHAWWSTREAATVLGVSSSRVNQLARNEQLPVVGRGGRHWFRADHLQLVLNARAAQHAWEREPSSRPA